MKMKASLTIFVALFAVVCLPCLSRAGGACMVSGLEGQAMVTHGSEQPRPVNKFKKIWPGDQIELSRDATMQLYYLALGQVEQWQGPARILVDDNGGRDQNNIQQPKVMTTGELSTTLKKSKVLNQQTAVGQIAIRGGRPEPPEDASLSQQGKQQLQQIHKNYGDMANKAAKGDITPDLIYLAGLEELGQKETMARHIHKLLSISGSNTDLEELLNEL
jgi:hypothetical protein